VPDSIGVAVTESDSRSGFTDIELDDRSFQKGLLTVFFLSIAGLALLYHSIYPLSLGPDTGYLAQVPTVFWPVVTGALAVSFVHFTVSSSDGFRFVHVVFVSMVLNYQQYLFFNFTGGDSASEISRWFVIQGLPRFDVELFNYFQWPVHFVFFEVFNKVLSVALMDMIRLGYASLYLVFTVGVVYVFYSRISRPLYWFGASVTYLIYMRLFLNNQLVPQFFALAILLFLFGLGPIRSVRSGGIQFVFYTVLVLAHPFFFVFYLVFVLVLPVVESATSQLTAFGGSHTPVYRSVFRTLSRPFSSVRSWIRDSSKRLLSSLSVLLVLSGIYIFFFIFRFRNFNDRVYTLISRPANSKYGSGTVLSRLYTIISDSPATASGPETHLLYDLSSPLLHRASVYVMISIFVLLAVLSVVVFVRKSTEHVSPIQISIGITGLAYYVGGFALPLIGDRGLQVALLPVGALVAGWESNARIIKVVLLLVLVLSPVFGLNGILNASITGGRNVQQHDAHEAGAHIVRHGLEREEVVLKYPHAGLPPEFTDREDRNVTTVEEIVRGEGGDPSVLVFGPRQIHTARTYGNDCNFTPRRRNVLYDNGVSVLTESSVSDRFECVPVSDRGGVSSATNP
jgi:hypothetical protein